MTPRLPLCRRAKGCENGKRIHPRAVHANRPVQMRARDSSRRAHLANRVAARHERAFTHVQDREVCEQRQDAEPVIDDDGVPGEIQLLREHDPAGVRGVNRRAGRTQEVGAAVRLTRFTIEDAPRSERAVRGPWNGSHEALGPEAIGCRVGP